MKRATVVYAIYMAMGGLGVIAYAIYAQLWPGVFAGLGILAFAALSYLAEKRSQMGRRRK